MSAENKKPQICAALLAHVDAGKTTLAESLLYKTGEIRSLGRVDNQDAFLDTYDLERARGITIFSKQASLHLKDWDITLLDTPGHVDFSAEMERTLQVLDYAVLLINGADGVQGHTETLWKLLKRYQVPTFLFVNKMDQEGTDSAKLLGELKERLSSQCVDFTVEENEDFFEEIATCDEELLEYYLEEGQVEVSQIRQMICERKLFPCYFGSALKVEGIDAFLEGLNTFLAKPVYPEEFAAKVYKISRDEQGTRLTHLKITGGSLKVKDILKGMTTEGEDWEEKVNQIRVYSGVKYEAKQTISAGEICSVTGLTKTWPGEGLGAEPEAEDPVLEPVLRYRLLLPEDVDARVVLPQIRQLEEEEPLLHVLWEESHQEIYVQLMGEVQIDVLKSMIWERYHYRVELDHGSILYKETIQEPVEGVGHFEPLRHYAEVHLLLEPGETGSGLQFFSQCKEDLLDRNWQRLILTHLEEKEHKGVLTGSPITDMRITLIAGRAHLKHTEGGDFRQATYRAVRQGLKKANSVLLEPYYSYRLEIPADMTGRAMSDIQRMKGQVNPPEMTEDRAILTGSVPVSTMRDYQVEVTAYTKGRGYLSCIFKGYEPCHNTEEVLEAIGYDSERDLANPTGSVFCAHGAGFVVPWDQVEEHMHLETKELLKSPEEKMEDLEKEAAILRARKERVRMVLSQEEEKELQKMMEQSYRKREKQRRFSYGKSRIRREEYTPVYRGQKKKLEKEYLLVDGYNIIFAWEELNDLAKVNIDAARDKLADLLSNYQGFVKSTLILVFDAYRLEGHAEEILKYHNIYIVYTKEAETADQYIERTAHEMGRKYQVTVATSDGTEQVIIRGQGCFLMSARELKEEVERVSNLIRQEYLGKEMSGKNYLFDYLDPEIAEQMEKTRLGGQTHDKKDE